MTKHIIFISCILFLTSCGGWSESDKSIFLDKCEKSKFNEEFCNCALENATAKYSTFDDATKNEIAFGELAIECIEKDRIETESPNSDED